MSRRENVQVVNATLPTDSWGVQSKDTKPKDNISISINPVIGVSS
jgi:hypothetical protein